MKRFLLELFFHLKNRATDHYLITVHTLISQLINQHSSHNPQGARTLNHTMTARQ